MGENENQFEEFSDLNQEPVTIQAPPEEPPKKSSKASVIISFVLIGALLIGSIVIGATTLSKKSKATEQNIAKSIETESGTWTQFRAYYATAEIVEYSHKYFYVIPVATEHFFLVASNDGSHYAVIRADKNWYEKNFTDGVANDPDGYLVEGYVRKTELKVRDKINEEINDYKKLYYTKFDGNANYFIDLLAKRISIYEIIIGLIPIVAGLFMITAGRRLLKLELGSDAGKKVGTVGVIFFLVYACFALHVIAML